MVKNHDEFNNELDPAIAELLREFPELRPNHWEQQLELGSGLKLPFALAIENPQLARALIQRHLTQAPSDVASLMDYVATVLDHQDLGTAAIGHEKDADAIRRATAAASSRPHSSTSVSEAVEIADATWAATAIGWISDGYRETITASGASAAIAEVLNLAWLPTPWAAAAGAAIGLAGAVAKVRLSGQSQTDG